MKWTAEIRAFVCKANVHRYQLPQIPDVLFPRLGSHTTSLKGVSVLEDFDGALSRRRLSREAAEECSAQRKPWVQDQIRTILARAKEFFCGFTQGPFRFLLIQKSARFRHCGGSHIEPSSQSCFTTCF